VCNTSRLTPCLLWCCRSS